MIEVNIELEETKQTYFVPENWDEVTVEKFMNVYRYKNGPIVTGKLLS